jgi:hypothetical protein
MTTPARYRALEWFADHERDPLSVLLRKRPSARMRNLMAREGQVVADRAGTVQLPPLAFDRHGRASAGRQEGRPK